MNDIFNIRRFGKYLASDARNCVADYGLSMLLISFMGLIIYTGTIIMGLIFNGEWGGPELSFRIFTFAISTFVLILTMPVKCYGRITEKRFGSQWLMTPASSFEKSLSMIIMTAIAAPLAMCTIYLGIDGLLCRIDPTCGKGIFASFKGIIDSFVELSFATTTEISQFTNIAGFFRQVTCPWLYLDDFIGMFLVTLTGAILFKSGKTVKTILSYIAITTLLGLAVIPFTTAFFKGFAQMSITITTPEELNQLFSGWIFRHAALIDTINDTLVNLALITVIYFRVKTLKH